MILIFCFFSPWKDPSLFHNRDKSKDKENGRNSYYGIKNFKRVSNNWVALMILTVAAVGAVLQAFLIRLATFHDYVTYSFTTYIIVILLSFIVFS